MKHKRFSCASVFLVIIICFTLPLLSQPAQSQCNRCETRKIERQRTISIVLSGIAQIANGLALIFNNTHDKTQCNEGVCNIIAGACTIAAQTSKAPTKKSGPYDLYTLLNEPEIFASIQKTLMHDSQNTKPRLTKAIKIDLKNK